MPTRISHLSWHTLLLTSAGSCLFLVSPVLAQTTTAHVQPYSMMGWDEDWSYLKNQSSSDPSDKWHYIPLGSSGQYMSITGQARIRWERTDYPGWGSTSADGYFMERGLLSTDWHLDSGVRVFAQLEKSNRDGTPRPGIDETGLNFNQAFLDYSLGATGPQTGTQVRLGRQLLGLGSGRLFSTGAGLNVQQPQDGAILTSYVSGFKVVVMALKPTQISAEDFKDKASPGKSSTTLYVSHSLPAATRSSLDVYWIDYENKKAVWLQGAGLEKRTSVGARLFANTPTWFYDLEYTSQSGSFRSEKIAAWGFGYHAGYNFKTLPLSPRAEVDGGITSGDHNLSDNKLADFNPLFPNGNYLSQSILVGPYNLNVIRPKLELHVTKKLTISPNVEFLWRQSAADGIYNVAGFPIRSGALTREKYIGTQFQVGVDYAPSSHVSLSMTGEHFSPGKFIQESTAGRSVNFISLQVQTEF